MTLFFPTVWPSGDFLTCSIICLTVFNRTTPVDFSDPASLGSVSAEEKKIEQGAGRGGMNKILEISDNQVPPS